MENTKVSFVHLHSPLFFAGRNWGEKIDVKNTAKGKVEMSYDRGEKELLIRCDGHTSYIPSSNIVSYTPLGETHTKAVKPTSDASANPNVNAQVSGPHDHVFAGLGQGQTGAGKKVK